MEKLINLEAFAINDYTFIACTAEWCPPCRKIKPHVMNFFKHGSDSVLKKTIDQTTYQLNINKYVPYFIIAKNFIDFENYEILDAVQTSDNKLFDIFLSKYMNIPELDENF